MKTEKSEHPNDDNDNDNNNDIRTERVREKHARRKSDEER